MKLSNCKLGRRWARAAGGAGLVALVTLSGCGTQPDAAEQPRARALALEGDAGLGADGGVASTGTYLVARFVDVAPEQQVTRFAAAQASRAADLAGFDPSVSGLELEQAQLAVAFGEAVFVTDSLSSSITRYDLNAEGALVPSATLSVADLGLATVMGWYVSIVSASKGYLFDPGTRRVVVWDPATMQLSGKELDLGLGQREGYTFDLGPRAAVQRGDTLFVPAYWYDKSYASRKASGLLAVNTLTDELTLAEDERCAGYTPVLTESGEIYSMPDGYFAEEFYLNALEQEPLCSLRVNADSTTFDPEFSLDLTGLVTAAGSASGTVQGGLPDGRGGVLLGVLDEERYAAGEAETYQLWRWTPATGSAEPLAGTPLWNGYIGGYGTGSDAVAVLPRVESSVVLPLADEVLTPFELPGWIEPFVRLR